MQKQKRSVSPLTLGLGIGGSLVAAYFYQPQRIDFFPVPAPDPNPSIDPNSETFFSSNARIAIVSAHPDDTEFYLGGTLTRLGSANAKILIIVCTDGDKGYYSRFLTDPEENRRVRRQEQIDAAAQYGADVSFLAKPDGRLKADSQLIGEILEHLAAFQPQYVLGFDPVYPPRLQHSDHLRSGIATEGALEGLSSVGWLLRYSTHAANFFVDISDLWSTKMDLLRIHRSQFAGNKTGMVEKLIRNRAESDGLSANVALAEGFRVTRLK